MNVAPVLRRMLRAGQRVKLQRLCPGWNGKEAVVVKLVPGQSDHAPILDDGWWTVALPDRLNSGQGPLHREFQRRYLRRVR